MTSYDAVVVGSGPNGLAAAIELARAGFRVEVREGQDTPGGGLRSEALTTDGFVHDTFSAVHPMAALSPFFRSLDLAPHGLRWIHPPAAVAHPLDGGRAVLLEGSVADTAATLGIDGAAYHRLLGPLAEHVHGLAPLILAPQVRIPRRPVLQGRFGALALRSAVGLAARFRTPEAAALFAGNAAHSGLPLDRLGSGGVGLVLTIAGHTVGWPIPAGGAGRVAGALVSALRSVGGQLATRAPVSSLDEVAGARAVLLDLTPRQVVTVGRDRLPAAYRRRLTRFRYGPAVFKVDWALDGPIPWSASGCARSATVHLGGELDEIVASERAVSEGRVAERPFLILTQPSLFDPSRAPPGKHTAWAYCHVPMGFDSDLTDRIEAQVERFAPGFTDRILARRVLSPSDLEARNPNLVGGDIGGGALDLRQLFFRPVAALDPYRTPVRGLFLCSSSTPPGGGVHGMCGVHAARSAMARLR
jgi:phytoene dehydrogenase-like protein